MKLKSMNQQNSILKVFIKLKVQKSAKSTINKLKTAKIKKSPNKNKLKPMKMIKLESEQLISKTKMPGIINISDLYLNMNWSLLPFNLQRIYFSLIVK